MPVIGERQVTGGNGRDSQTEKSRYRVGEGIWLRDKCRIIAVIRSSPLFLSPPGRVSQ